MENKSLFEVDQEEKMLYNTFDNTYEDFPIGSKVKIICSCQDFNFFFKETGEVVDNKGQYLGITVKFDTPRHFKDGSIQTEFNFEPSDLTIIHKVVTKCVNPYCTGKVVTHMIKNNYQVYDHKCSVCKVNWLTIG